MKCGRFENSINAWLGCVEPFFQEFAGRHSRMCDRTNKVIAEFQEFAFDWRDLIFSRVAVFKHIDVPNISAHPTDPGVYVHPSATYTGFKCVDSCTSPGRDLGNNIAFHDGS